MRRCPKCGSSVSSYAAECPRCGIVFRKYQSYLAKKKAAETDAKKVATSEKSSQNDRLKKILKTKKIAAPGTALVVLLFILLAYFTLPKQDKGLSPTEVARKVKSSLGTVRVLSNKSPGMIIEGIGFFLDDKGHFITHSDLLRNTQFVEVKSVEGKVYAPKAVLSQDEVSGLLKLLLEPAKQEESPVLIEEVLPAIGDRVYIVDCRTEAGETIIDMPVSNMIDVSELGQVFQLGTPPSERLDGCPVFNSSAKLVGFITGASKEDQPSRFIVPCKALKRLHQQTMSVGILDWLAANMDPAIDEVTSVADDRLDLEENISTEEKHQDSPHRASSRETLVPFKEAHRRIDPKGNLDEKTAQNSIIEKACNATVTIKTALATGSGFFITDSGYILTNRHVIEGAENYVLDLQKTLNRTRSSLTDAVKRKEEMEIALRREGDTLTILKNELDYLNGWLREKQKKLHSCLDENHYNHLLRTWEERRIEFNQKVNTYNTLLETYKAHLNKFERVKSQVEALQKRESELSDAFAKRSYQPPVQIVLADGKKHQVKQVSVSQNHDLALLRFSGHKGPWLEAADSARVAKGQKVFAIGSPVGLSHSVTSGVFSAHRGDMLQTSALINPGNSGGPLLTEDGKVIGINTSKWSEEGVEGISFAIPINVAMEEFKMYF